jgi:ferredoxin-NADP reductase
MQVNTFPISLDDTRMLSPKVKHFIFRSTQEAIFDYLPGQFITVHFQRDDKIIRRSYSIANKPALDNCIEFAAGFVEGGPGTDYLFNLKPGDHININGPFGRLILKEETPNRYIFVATSTGITPYRAMIAELKQRLAAHPDLHIVILFGVQTREDILYHDELTAFAAFSPRISLRIHLSREVADNLREHEYPGYVQDSFSALNLNPEHDIFYLCGNPAMIDDAFASLKDHGFNTQHVIREKYISR